MDLLPRRALGLAVAATLTASAVWVVLAWRTPTSTFHFAPLVAGAVGPYVAKSRLGPVALGVASRIAAMSALVVAIAIAALLTAGKLQGPTFWSTDGAGLEAVLFAGLGLTIGLTYLVAGHGDSAVANPAAPG